MDVPHEKIHALTNYSLDEWVARAQNVEEEDHESIRVIKQWDEGRWQPFPDSGSFQSTGLTGEKSDGRCSAIWLKLEPGEKFDPHRHPNAIHTMLVYEGEADCFWQDADAQVYSGTMRVGRKPYVILPTQPHAIFANRGVRAIILVINVPPDDIRRHDYSVPVTK